MTEPGTEKRMRLRYAGTCRSCSAEVAAGEQAVYFKATKQVECLACRDDTPSPAPGAAAPMPKAVEPVPVQSSPVPSEPEMVDVGVAGASARREHERRAAKREERVRAAHPKLGGFLLSIQGKNWPVALHAADERGALTAA